jgi:NAD-dependent SIR2 family protein deacetylase
MEPRLTWRHPVEVPLIPTTTDPFTALQSLEPQSLAILVGAGISVDEPSHMPTASEFMRMFYEACLPASCDKELFTNAGLRFEAVVDVLQHWFDPALNILDIFRGDRPNRNHRHLISLASRGALIVTTNFDTLIEAAASNTLSYKTRISSQDFSDFASDEHCRSRPSEVWHLHGAVTDPRSGADCRETIIASIRDCWRSQDMFRLEQSKGHALRRTLLERDLVVLGYSGSDDYDISPALEDSPSQRRLVWVKHAFGDVPPIPPVVDMYPSGESWYREPYANSLATMLSKQIRPKGGVCILHCDAGTALQSLVSLPIARETSPTQNAAETSQPRSEASDNSIEAWHSHFLAYGRQHFPGPPSRYLLAALLCDQAGLYDERKRLLDEFPALQYRLDPSVTHSEFGAWFHLFSMTAASHVSGLERLLRNPEIDALMGESPELKVLFLEARGKAHYGAEQYDIAIKYLKECLHLRQASGLLRDIEVPEHELAHALFAKNFPARKFKRAYSMAEQSLRSALRAFHPEGICRALLLLARINEERGRIADAGEQYQRACDAAYRSGQDRLIAISCGEYGIHLLTDITKYSSEEMVKRVRPLLEDLDDKLQKSVQVLEQFFERQRRSIADEMMRAVRGLLERDLAQEPPKIKEGDRVRCERCSSLLARAFRIHYRQQHWRELVLIASNLSDCLALLGERQRSLLADCTVFQVCTNIRDLETLTMALSRIKQRAPREFPGIENSSLEDESFVRFVQRELLDRGVLI